MKSRSKAVVRVLIFLQPNPRYLLRRLACTAVLAATPWLPGLLAIPMLAAAGRTADAAPVDAPTAAAPAVTSTPDPAAEPAPELPPAPYDSEEVFRPAKPIKPGETWVEVDLTRQRVRVYKEKTLLKDMIASTGVPDKPTPQGSFRLENRGEWFFSEKYQQGGFYWVSFLNNGQYLFHSVPTDRRRRFIPEEAARLGTPASHGCVRLTLEDARWIYDNLPRGTRVEIHP